jgi:hypothetical protein
MYGVITQFHVQYIYISSNTSSPRTARDAVPIRTNPYKEQQVDADAAAPRYFRVVLPLLCIPSLSPRVLQMTPQNIVPVSGLNEVSGSGLLIGWLRFRFIIDEIQIC